MFGMLVLLWIYCMGKNKVNAYKTYCFPLLFFKTDISIKCWVSDSLYSIHAVTPSSFSVHETHGAEPPPAVHVTARVSSSWTSGWNETPPPKLCVDSWEETVQLWSCEEQAGKAALPPPKKMMYHPTMSTRNDVSASDREYRRVSEIYRIRLKRDILSITQFLLFRLTAWTVSDTSSSLNL